jgi:hypothetical protein
MGVLLTRTVVSWVGTVEVLMGDSESASGVDWGGGGGGIGDGGVWGGRAVFVNGIPGWSVRVSPAPSSLVESEVLVLIIRGSEVL